MDLDLLLPLGCYCTDFCRLLVLRWTPRGCLQPCLGSTRTVTALSIQERVGSSHSTQLVRGAGVGAILWKLSLQCRGSFLFVLIVIWG